MKRHIKMKLYKEKMLKLKIFILFIGFVIAAKISFAQQDGPVNFTFDSKIKQQTVKKISSLLDENYIFPDLAKKMGDLIKQNLAAGSYEGIDDPMKFAETLTADLQSVSNDKHIRVRFSPEDAKRLIEQEKKGSDPDDEKHWNEMMKKENYGFKSGKTGNIGYVDFRISPDYSKNSCFSYEIS
jgi:hypothetical protein